MMWERDDLGHHSVSLETGNAYYDTTWQFRTQKLYQAYGIRFRVPFSNPLNTFIVMTGVLSAISKTAPASLWGMKVPAESSIQ